jgi:shikimate kinase
MDPFQARIDALSARIETESLKPEDQINKQLIKFLTSERQELYKEARLFHLDRERRLAERQDAAAMRMGGMSDVAAQPASTSYNLVFGLIRFF